MDNIEIINTKDISGNITESVILYNADGSYTSMLKSTWDELEARKTIGEINE
jgi:hypothetical protein